MQFTISLYYNKDFGFIYASETINTRTKLPALVNPVFVSDSIINISEFSNNIKQAFEICKRNPTMEITESYPFWQVAGKKTFTAFSKAFSTLNINEENGKYIILKAIREPKSGGYILDKSVQPLVFNELSDEAVQQIYQLLTGNENVVTAADKSFETPYDTIVTYKDITDDFNDIGDGHTDAYQIYTDPICDDNYIGFMINTTYESFEEVDMLATFQRFYDPLIDFQYKKIDDERLYAVVQAKNQEALINSTIFKNNGDYLEVFYYIDVNASSKEHQDYLEKTFQNVINSINITGK